MDRNVGMLVAAVGAIVVVVGLLIASGALSWFGRLPGDIRFTGERSRVYVPITSAIVASIVLTLLFNVIARFFR